MERHRIIECVEQHPVLYDQKYERKPERRQAWAEVAKQLNQDMESVKRKWKNIKDEYVKFLKGVSKSENYGFASQMMFLNPHLRGLSSKVKIANNIEHEESDEENNSPNRSTVSLNYSPDSMNGLDLIFLGVSKLMRTHRQDSQEPVEALSSLDELDQTCLKITNIIKTYAESEPHLVNRKINKFFEAQCGNNNNQSTSDDSDDTINDINDTKYLKINFNFKRLRVKEEI